MNKLLHKGSKVIQRDTAKLVPIGREVTAQLVPTGREDTAHDNEQLVPRKLGDRSSRKIKKCRIANVQYPIMNEECKMLKKEQENNIPVLRTCGYHGEPCATNIDGALHLGFQTTGTAISETAAAPRNTLSDIQWNCRTFNGETAAAPRNILPNIRLICQTSISETAAAPRNILPNIRLICQTSISKTAAAPRNTLSDCRRICRTAGHPSGKKVQSTETLKENKEYRITNNESGRKIPVQGRLIPEGLHVYSQPVSRRNSTPAGVAQPVVSYRFYKHLMPPASGSRKTEGERVRECESERVRGCESERVRNGEIVIENNNQYSMMNEETGNNIPVLRTSGYYAVSYSTKIDGALHLGFQTTGIAISETAAAPRNTLSGIQWNCRTFNGETAAAPRNICRAVCRSLGRKVQRTVTLNGNEEYRIMNKESGRKIPVQGRLIPEGLHVYRKAVNRENSTPAGVAHFNSFWYIYKHLMPLASGKPDRRTETLNGNTMQVTMQVTAHDTMQVTAHDTCKLGDRLGDRLGYALGDKKTKTNLKKEIKNKIPFSGAICSLRPAA